MHSLKKFAIAGLCVLCSTGIVQDSFGQTAPIVDRIVPVHIVSGDQINTEKQAKSVYSHLVRLNNASSMQITFGRTTLPQGTKLRMMSLQDGAIQHHTASTLKQWRNKSAWFNGSSVLVELVAEPNTTSTHFTIDWVSIIEQLGEDRSICGPADDRVLSYEDRDGRAMPIGCSAWIIDDVNHTLLTAGHCADDGTSDIGLVQFNVPLSDPNGNVQHPGPEDQYATDAESFQSAYSTIGDDWAYFGCFPNTETGMTPFEAQNDFYVLSDAAPTVDGQLITITGYGTTSSPVPNEYNQAQKTHTGPYTQSSGTSIGYQTDTTGGNSGSAVLNEATGEAIGIHTNGGCSEGENWGNAIHNPGLQTALANPQGVCIPNIMHFDFPSALPYDVLPNTTTTVQFYVTAGEEEPVPDQVGVVVEVNGNQESIGAMYLGNDLYEVTLPALLCDDVVDYYFEATSDQGTIVYSPYSAPSNNYDLFVGTIVQKLIMEEGFEDGIPSGWSASGLWNTTTSCLPSGECAGGAAAYFGVTSSCTFDNGGTVAGELTTPVISLEGYIGDLILSFCSAVETENISSYDHTDLYINGSLYANLDESTDWEQVEIALTDFTSPTIQIEWRFDSVDSLYNDYRGWHIDGIQLVTQTLDCNDDIGCPADANGDGFVNVSDLLTVIDDWGLADSPADINGDGIVNVTDLLAVVGAWGPCE
jgi:V8-like Glu-specific endopeptidase